MVAAADDSSFQVYKILRSNEKRPEPYIVDTDLLCSCEAGEHGIECKHSKMADRTLIGNDVDWRTAKRLVDQWLRSVKATWPDARIESLLDYREPTKTINVAHALMSDAGDMSHERLTLWMEIGSLLLVVHSFRDTKRLERTLRKFKAKQRGA